eukprot:3966834-Lingulodinium_polyedra.AAC.1
MGVPMQGSSQTGWNDVSGRPQEDVLWKHMQAYAKSQTKHIVHVEVVTRFNMTGPHLQTYCVQLPMSGGIGDASMIPLFWGVAWPNCNQQDLMLDFLPHNV